MKFFRSLCRTKTPSRPVNYTGGQVQLIYEKEQLIVAASLVLHCWAIRKKHYCCITVTWCCQCTVHSRADWAESRLSL